MLSMIKTLSQRKVEGVVGVPLLELLGRLELQHSGLVGPKKVFLPRSGVFVNYYEKKAIAMKETSFGAYHDQQHKRPVQTHRPPPTLLLYHGIGRGAPEMCSLLRTMSDIPPHVRILIPEWTRSSSGNSQHDPKGTSELAGDASKILEHNSEFLEVAVRESSRCNALGTSLGGGLLYFLRAQNPHKIQRTALVAPVIPSVLAEPLVSGLSERSNPFLEFGDRDDVQSLVRNHLWTDPRRRTGKDTDDPLPDVLYEALYQSNAATKSKGVLQDQLFDHARGVANDGETTTNVFSTTSDLDPDCRRLLVWPEDDQISSLESGRRFFGPSLEAGNTRLVTVSECGHVFDAQRRLLMERVAPEVQDFLLDFSQEQ